MHQSIKNLLAVVLLVFSVVIGIPMMLQGDSNVNLNNDQTLVQIYDIPSSKIQELPKIRDMVDDGLRPYFWGMGLIFLFVAIAFVLVDGEDSVATLKGTEQEDG